ncbi:MAG: hypothetical protein K6357_00165 [Elusimicrobiota bacterium]
MRFLLISLLVSFSLFSCQRRIYNEKELITAFVKHSYYDYKEEDIKKALENGVDGLKKIDKNFEFVPLKGKRIRKSKADKPTKEFFYPFVLKKYGDGYIILKVFDYTIAYEAGLKPGLLNSINKMNLKDIEPQKLEENLENSKELTISFNDGNADYSMKVKKEIAAFPFVWSVVIDSQTAYINILSFAKNSSVFIRNNIMNLRKRAIKKLIIDLRDISGGDYEEVAKIIGYFSKDKKTYFIKSSKEGYTKSFGEQENIFTDFKLVVIIDRNTALLGEVMAQSFKENGALIVGEKTGGNVYITKLFKVGNETAAKITVAKIYSSSGKDLDEGVIPDYSVRYENYKKMGLTYVIDADTAISKALELF